MIWCSENVDLEHALEKLGPADVGLKPRSLELSAGLNWSRLLGRFRPHAGIGGALLFLELRGIVAVVDVVCDDHEWTTGACAKAGLLFHASRTLHHGFELQHFEGGDVRARA